MSPASRTGVKARDTAEARRPPASSTALGPEASAPKTTERRPLDERAELQAWYLGSLRPKLRDAARAGTVEPAAVATLDRLVRDFLDLPAARVDEAA